MQLVNGEDEMKKFYKETKATGAQKNYMEILGIKIPENCSRSYARMLIQQKVNERSRKCVEEHPEFAITEEQIEKLCEFGVSNYPAAKYEAANLLIYLDQQSRQGLLDKKTRKQEMLEKEKTKERQEVEDWLDGNI